ncbi:MAG: ABC transporter permease [Anaerolineales bacterium]|nr:ABC transporter permease [Anaerolineales bacterium]
MTQPAAPHRTFSLRDFLLSYGFLIVLLVVVAIYAVLAPNFLTVANVMSILHSSAPLMVIASGLAIVVMTGKLDISVGSIAFLSAAIGILLMTQWDVAPALAMPVVLVTGIVLGTINGLIVVGLRVNPLITTLGTMIAYRGIALQLTNSRAYSVPETIRWLGNATIEPVFFDILLGLAVMVIIYLLHTRTAFGRHVMAIGNGEEVASRLGVRVSRVTFLTFVLSGLLASLGGIVGMLQVGAVSSYLGGGLEFTAVAVIVIGGISLFGGSGSILPGLLLGILTPEIIPQRAEPSRRRSVLLSLCQRRHHFRRHVR